MPMELLDRLRAAADEARALHYAPYSKVVALAAAMTIDGSIAGGSNVENANFSLTKHAEEIAILRALALDGVPPAAGRLACVYVAGPAPCGSCRQFAAEFGSPDAYWVAEPVDQAELVAGNLADLPHDRRRAVISFADALPLPFTASVFDTV